uniref:Uncharacterized protein n=1 Tax=Arundo donax TaxID=35708 RepID=A0A0A9E1W4_ARUDO
MLGNFFCKILHEIFNNNDVILVWQFIL